MRRLIRADCADALERLDAESADLIYLDPPFNSNRIYGFAEGGGGVAAFGDVWRGDVRRDPAWRRFADEFSNRVVVGWLDALRAMRGDDSMIAYLAWIAPRLGLAFERLKPSGCLYLHCDQSASHHLRALADGLFGAERFRGEIIWHRYNKIPDRTKRVWMKRHDAVLFYTRDDKERYHFRSLSRPTGERVRRRRMKKRGGRIVALDETIEYERSRLLTASVIDDVPDPVVGDSRERRGYPTQKPIELLRRIIESSCPEGGVVLDPFAGSGTTLHAAESLGRRWIGIDRSPFAVGMSERRLRDALADAGRPKERIVREGVPTTAKRARAWADSDPDEFAQWLYGLAGARGVERRDGTLLGTTTRRRDGGRRERGRLLFCDGKRVKRDVDALRGALAEDADLRGVLLCFADSEIDVARRLRSNERLDIVLVEKILQDTNHALG